MKTKGPHRLAFSSLLVILAATFLPLAARAAFVFQLSQAGSDVVVTGSGTLNLAGLTPGGMGFNPSGILAFGAFLAIDPAGDTLQEYAGASGPADWGSGGLFLADSSSGDDILFRDGMIYVLPSYVSGSFLSNTMTFNSKTFSDLGFIPGTYTYTWGSGATADSLTVTTEVPEPSTWALLGVGGVTFLGLALRLRAKV